MLFLEIHGMQHHSQNTPSCDQRNIICVSGMYKSGKSNFSIRLASALKLEHFSMRKIKNLYESYIDWEKILQNENNQEIDQMIINMAHKGNCVLDFRFAPLLCSLQNIPYCGIWIYASLDVRVEANTFFWKKSELKTKDIILKREFEEVRSCMELYGRDFRDPDLYDIFIDTTDYWLPITIPMDTTPLVAEYLPEIKKNLKKAHEK